MRKLLTRLFWAALALLGAFAFAGIAIERGEPVTAFWLVIAAVSIYLVGYRFYASGLPPR